MGDHRASIKIEFTMHGVTTKLDLWINWWSGAAHDLPSAVVDFFNDAETASLHAWYNREDSTVSKAKAKRAEIVRSARLKLTNEEWQAIEDEKNGR